MHLQPNRLGSLCELVCQWHTARLPVLALLFSFVMCALTNAEAQSPPVGTIITNRAETSFKDSYGNSYPSEFAEVSTEVGESPRLILSNRSFPSIAEVGDILTNELSYTNRSNAISTKVVMVDKLSPSVSFRYASGNGVYDPDAHTVTWDLGELAIGSSASQLVETRITDFEPGSKAEDAILNIARITTNEGDTATDSSAVLEGKGADFNVKKSVDRTTIVPGGRLNYSISILNTGNATGVETRINDELPEGVELDPTSLQFPYTLDDRSLAISLGDLQPLQSKEVTFAVEVSTLATVGSKIHNQAIGSAKGTTGNLSNVVISTVIEGGPLDFTLISSPNDTIAGEAYDYRLTLTNTDSSRVTGLRLRQPLPDNTNFVSINNNGTFDGSEANWTLPVIDPGAVVELEWRVSSATNLVDGSQIEAVAFALVDTIPELTATATTQISARTPATVTILDENFASEQIVFYQGDTGFGIEVADGDQNLNEFAIDHIQVIISNDSNAAQTASASGIGLDYEIIELSEVTPNSGIFRGPGVFNLTEATPGDGALFVEPATPIFVAYRDDYDLVDVVSTVGLYQPVSVLFNALSGDVVADVNVALLNDDGTPANFVDPNQSNQFISDSDGRIIIPPLDIPAGSSVDLKFEVTPPADSGLAFPSEVPDDSMPEQLSTGQAPQIDLGSRGETFTLESAQPAITFDLPMDPPSGGLRIEKRASRAQIAVGEIISYEISVTNNGLGPVTDLEIIDTPPREFRYFEGSSQQEDKTLDDPELFGDSLVWKVGTLNSGEEITMIYRMMIGVDTKRGTYTNMAYATGSTTATSRTTAARLTPTEVTAPPSSQSSNVARAEVIVTEGIFTRDGIIIGRVYIDLNGNQRYDKGEPGQPDAWVYLEDGSYVITDEYGRYSSHRIEPGQHVLRLDEESLPPTVRPSGSGGHFMDRANSQWVEMYASGLVKANFPVAPVSDNARAEILRDLNPEPLKEKVDTELISSGIRVEDSSKALTLEERGKQLEEQIKHLDDEFAFLNLVDQQELSGNHTDILFKFPRAAQVSITINGKPIDEGRLGAKLSHPVNGVTLVEYIAVPLKSGVENVIAAELKDPFGNVRDQRTVHVFTLAKVDRIELEVPDIEVSANGRNEIPITARVINTRGAFARQVDSITVNVAPASIVETDLDLVNSGHQVEVIDGIANFTLRAPRKPGTITITAQSNQTTAEAECYFKPHLRDLMVIGSGELFIGSSKTDGDIGKIDNVFDDKIEDGENAQADAALFAKGDIGYDTLMTVIYDTDKKEQDDYFYARETDDDDEGLILISGDDSLTDYEGYSRDPLFARLDRGESNVMWGDYYTEISPDQLSYYNRTFTGFRSKIKEEHYEVTGFAAEMKQDQVVDALAAKGTSGYYYLSRNPIVFGSERVVVETRDRLRPSRVIERRELTRQTDYQVDYYDGTILTEEPIPTYDDELNPNILIISYEVEDEANDNWAYGARAETQVTESVTVGVTRVTEESVLDDYVLQGGDIAYHLESIDTVFKAEYSETESLFAENGIFDQQDGDATRYSFEGTPTEQLEVSGYYQDVSEFFYNQSAVDALAGTENFGADARYHLSETNSLTFEAYQENDRLYDNEFSHLSAGWEGVINDYRLGAGLYRDEFEGDSNNTGLDDPFDEGGRTPFDSTPEQVSQDIGLRLSAGKAVNEKLDISTGHSQDLQNTGISSSHVRLEYEISEGRSVYLTERYDRYEDRDELRTLFGVESTLGQNTTTFSEYQYEDSGNGQELNQSTGLRHRYKYGAKISGNATFENLNTLSGEEGSSQPDGYATTLSTTFLPVENWRITNRLEYRDDTSVTSQLGEVGVNTKVSEDLSAMIRIRYYDIENNGQDGREEIRLSLGFAWRPTENDRFHALSRLDWWKEDFDEFDQTQTEEKIYGSIEGIYDLTDEITLTGKYAGKQYELGDYSVYNDMIAVRSVYMYDNRIEFGATVRHLNEYEFDNSTVGGALDVGCAVWKFVWMTVGYSYDEFDADLAGQDYSGEGWFVKFRFKFDEQTGKDIKSAFASHP